MEYSQAVAGLFLTSQYLSDFVDTLYASWRLHPLTAVDYQRYRIIPLEDKKAGDFDFSKPPAYIRTWVYVCYTTAFFLCRRAADLTLISQSNRLN